MTRGPGIEDRWPRAILCWVAMHFAAGVPLDLTNMLQTSVRLALHASGELHPTPPTLQSSAGQRTPTSMQLGGSVPAIQWLHIPKTGTSFVNTIYRYACSDIPVDATVGCEPPVLGLTFPYPPDQFCMGGFVDTARVNGHPPAQYPEDNGHIVSMFRNTIDRKISHLDYWVVTASNDTYINECVADVVGAVDGVQGFGRSCWGGGESNDIHAASAFTLARQVLGDALGGPAKCGFLKAVLPSLTGCSSKMVIGRHCCDIRDGITEAHLARRMPSAFAFVGLTEHWAESVCLFHLLLGGDTLLPVEFMDVRPTPKTGIDWLAEAKACGTAELLVEDPLDDALYDMAVRRFQAEVSEAEHLHPGMLRKCVAAHQ